MGQVAKESQLIAAMGFLEVLEEASAKVAREHPNRQEKSWAAGDPAPLLSIESATWHDAVQMWMETPSVKRPQLRKTVR